MSFWPACGHAARENTSKNAVFGRVIGLLLAAGTSVDDPHRDSNAVNAPAGPLLGGGGSAGFVRKESHGNPIPGGN